MPGGSPQNLPKVLTREQKIKHAMHCCATYLVKKGYDKREALEKAKRMYIWSS